MRLIIFLAIAVVILAIVVYFKFIRKSATRPVDGAPTPRVSERPSYEGDPREQVRAQMEAERLRAQADASRPTQFGGFFGGGGA